MKKKNLFSIVLAVVMLVNMTFLPQSVSALEESVSWQEKIDD